jgi:threonine/homoserine/homoserine lactone efflux protein
VNAEALVLPLGYGLGFLAAIPIGASQIEVVKRALAGRYGAALLSAAGTVTSDMAYGCLALLGAARFLEHPAILGAVQGGAAVVLSGLAIVTWRQSKSVALPGDRLAWADAGASYLTGLSVGLSYPPIMFSWLAGMAVVKILIAQAELPPAIIVGFVVAGGAGLFSYMAVLTLMLRRTRRFYSSSTIRNVYRSLSILLGVIAVALLCRAAWSLVGGRWPGL